jgi:hypothetical protein
MQPVCELCFPVCGDLMVISKSIALFGKIYGNAECLKAFYLTGNTGKIKKTSQAGFLSKQLAREQ